MDLSLKLFAPLSIASRFAKLKLSILSNIIIVTSLAGVRVWEIANIAAPEIVGPSTILHCELLEIKAVGIVFKVLAVLG